MKNQKGITAIEFSFDASNFLHLTGLKVKKARGDAADADGALSAKEFYERCLAHRLRTTDFEFAKDGTTPLKLDVLPTLISKNLSATMIGDYNSRNPKLVTDKLAGGTAACMGFVPTGTKPRYVPNTILKVDIRNYIRNQARVIAVYCKPASEAQYTEATYFVKKVDWDAIQYPEEYAYLPRPISNVHRLAIIGNGFDIAHGLKTQFCAFAEALPDNIKSTYKLLLTGKDVTLMAGTPLKSELTSFPIIAFLSFSCTLLITVMILTALNRLIECLLF